MKERSVAIEFSLEKLNLNLLSESVVTKSVLETKFTFATPERSN